MTEFPVVKSNKKIAYINIPCGFDIETTSAKVQGEKVAFMYVWMLGIGHDTPIIYGRTWSEFVETCDQLTAKHELSKDKRLVIYVHNLAYEFQFMRNHFEWESVFALSDRKPATAVTKGGIEFRCSYVLSGFSLAHTAKNLTKHKIAKAVGDLDYSLVHTHDTPLTSAEYGYCDNDIRIITAYIDEQLDLYKNIYSIPMTNTGRVRQYVRNECLYPKNKHGKLAGGYAKRYRDLLKGLTLDPDGYIQMKRGFMGGFTHANANHTGKLLNDVTSIDFTSAYPAVMVSEKFPMGKFRKVEIKSMAQLEEYCNTHSVIMDVTLENVTPKLTQETYLSESKCFHTINPVVNNGRIVSADRLTTTITDVDYDILKKVYNWDNFGAVNIHVAKKGYLPKPIIKSILDLYQGKTELKDVAGSEVEYLLSKGMLNSIYGMSVTDIVKDQATYDDEWAVEKADVRERVADYNKSKNRFMFYPWGLWVTAYARRNLWTGIVAVGDDYVYADTDSLKLLNYDRHKAYVQWFDAQIIEKMESMCDHYKLDKSLLKPKTKDGVEKMLGIWDYEGTYPRFKTLGAKRYLVEDKGKLKLTVAGLSKQRGIEYMLEQNGGDFDKTFESFTDQLYIPADRTGKMTHTYIDEPAKFKIKDYLGNESTVETLSGVHLESCDFTLSIAEKYRSFLANLSQGYIFKGVTYK